MKTSRPRWLGLLAIALGVTVQPINSTMIVVALSRIAEALQADAAQVAWLVTSYLLALVIAQPVMGKLSDRIGHRRMFLLGQVGFATASLGATLGLSLSWLVLCRVGQAIMGAALVPSGAAMLRHLYAQHERGQAFGVYNSVLSLTAAAGPVIAGYVVSFADWPSIFYFGVPVNLLSFVLVLYLIPSHLAQTTSQRRSTFDVWGAVTLGATLLGVMLTLQQGPLRGWNTTPMVALAAGTLLCAGLFVTQERRHPEPMVNLAFFRNLRFTAAVTSVFFQSLVTYSTFVMMPLFLQNVQGRSAQQAGWAIAMQAMAGGIVTPLGGTLSDRFGRRWPAVFGTVLLLCSASMQLLVHAETPLLWIAGGMLMMGIAGGLSGASIQTSALEAVAPEMSGIAAGLYSTMRYLGNTTGSVLLGIALAGETHTASGFERMFTWLIVGAVGAIIAAWGLPAKRERSERMTG